MGWPSVRITRPPPLAVPASLLVAAGTVHAQMYHLYLQCQGDIAAGPAAAAAAASSPTGVLVAARSTGARTADKEDKGDKNVGDTDPNLQARTRSIQGAVKRGDAFLDLALRDNNMTATVQRSNVLPPSERMKYSSSQTHYTVNHAPRPTGVVASDWRGSWLFAWYPPFQKLSAVRFSVDRQTGALEGDIVGPAGETLGLIDMQCTPRRDADLPAPRF
jgi:hypothetical protein